MKKKVILLIVYLFGGLLLGGAAEYMFFQLRVREDILSGRKDVPRLREPSESDEFSTMVSLPKYRKETFDQRIHKYSCLNSEEILKELEKWNHAGLPQVFDWSRWSLRDYMAIRYLFYRLGVIAPEQGVKFRFDAFDLDSVLTGHVLYSWAEQSPDAAFDFFLKNRERFSPCEPHLDKLVKQMARKDPKIVWTKIDKLNDKERNDVLPVLWKQLMLDFPEKWEDFVPELDKRSLSSLKCRMMIARQWGKRDMSKVYELAYSQPAEYRREICSAGLAGMMEVDKEGATREFLKMTEGARRTPAIVLTKVLSKKSSLEALKWVQKYGSDSNRELSKTEGAMGVDYFIAKEVKDFVAKMPSGDLKERCVVHILDRCYFINNIFSPMIPMYYVDDRDDSFNLACQMELGESRIECLKMIFFNLLNEKSVETVKKYLENPKLTKEERNRIKSFLYIAFGYKFLSDDANYFLKEN